MIKLFLVYAYKLAMETTYDITVPFIHAWNFRMVARLAYDLWVFKLEVIYGTERLPSAEFRFSSKLSTVLNLSVLQYPHLPCFSIELNLWVSIPNVLAFNLPSWKLPTLQPLRAETNNDFLHGFLPQSD